MRITEKLLSHKSIIPDELPSKTIAGKTSLLLDGVNWWGYGLDRE